MDLSREIRKVRSDIPIIICTGYSDRINKTSAKEEGIQEMLMKPVSAGDLKAAIQRVSGQGTEKA